MKDLSTQNSRTLTNALLALLAAALATSLHAQSSSTSTGSTTRSPSTITTSPTPNSPSRVNNSNSPIYGSTNSNTNTQNSLPPSNTNNSGSGTSSTLATDPAYRLSIGDELSIDVHGEPDMSTAQRIDQQGNVRVPQLNEVNLANKNVREAESYLEQLYVEKRLLKKPLVNINVREYSSRQVTIIGAVNGPGIFHLPREADSIEIVELITSIGGFRPTAKSDAVRVTRNDTNTGKETTTYVDVEAMIYNRRNALKSFKVYPGDRILVTERIW